MAFSGGEVAAVLASDPLLLVLLSSLRVLEAGRLRFLGLVGFFERGAIEEM